MIVKDEKIGRCTMSVSAKNIMVIIALCRVKVSIENVVALGVMKRSVKMVTRMVANNMDKKNSIVIYYSPWF